MKFLSLLTVAIVLIGITTQAFACNYERMSRIPNYAKITTPKKILNVPQAHGICVAPNGNFAVVSWNNAGKIYMYYSCGKLMKVVTLRGFGPTLLLCIYRSQPLCDWLHKQENCTNSQQMENSFESLLLE